MDIITTSLEALIQRATNVNNPGPDTAAIDAYCGLIEKEPDSAQAAASFIASKLQSLNEWEALQALLVLETCMKKCGPAFRSEVGKFRFLNELVRLVSPKYMGPHTPEPVKNRVLELMYLWTVQFPRETKIKEAYDMLKKQGVVKGEPQLSVREKQGKDQPSILQDEEKSQLLQKLLQSKNPDDLQAANRLIKSMVKEKASMLELAKLREEWLGGDIQGNLASDEMTALSVAPSFDERKMEEKWRHAAELERAVNNCRLLKEMLDNWDPSSGSKEDLELMKELQTACVSLRPLLQRLASTPSDPAFCENVISANEELNEVLASYEAFVKAPSQTTDSLSSLLELAPPRQNPKLEPPVHILAGLNLGGTEVGRPESSGGVLAATAGAQRSAPSLLLEDIFGNLTTPSCGPPPSLSLPPSSLSCSEKVVPSPKENPKSKGLEELDLLGKSLLQESLLLSKNSQNNKQNKPPKVSLIEMHLQSVSCKSGWNAETSSCCDVSLLDTEPPPLESAADPGGSPAVLPDKESEPQPKSVLPLTSSNTDQEKSEPEELQVRPLAELDVTLDSIKPSKVPPFNALEERNGISVAIFLAKDRPRPDVSVFVVTTSSKSQSPLENFLFQPVVPKPCRLRLLAASSSTLPAHNPFLPPSAITQIMLIAAPHKEPIVLKFVISYIMDGETTTELGEITQLPLVE